MELISVALDNPLSPAEDNSEQKVCCSFSHLWNGSQSWKVEMWTISQKCIVLMLQEADRLKCATSVVHQADQACRRLISEAMKAARGQLGA